MKKILLISCLFLQNCVIRLPSDGQTNDTNDMVFVTAYERGGNGAHPMPNDGSKLEGNNLTVLMMSDLINYDVVNHRAYISESAMNKIDKAMANFAALIVWAGQDAIYAGEFYSPVQSGTAPGVVIVPTIDDDNKPCLAIELGYPSRAFYKGMEDVRSDKKLMEWLRQCNKIRGE